MKIHFILFTLCFAFTSVSNAQLQRFSYSKEKMGSPFNLIFYANDSKQADSLAKNCFVLIDSLNAHYSDYDSSSELSKLSKFAGVRPLKVSPLLFDLLLLSQLAYKKSQESFDITIGPLSRLWRKARKEKVFPDKKAVLAKKKLVNFSKIKLNTKKRELYLPIKGMQLDLGGIAKGYTAEAVISYLKANGIVHALADAGGDMAMSGAPPGSPGWTISVNVPESTEEVLNKNLSLQNQAVATSGSAFQYMEYKGKKYSHIIDPRTGYGITSLRNVTVVAKDGATADWLATACSIASFNLIKKMVAENNASVLITEMEKGKIVYHSFGAFDQYWKK